MANLLRVDGLPATATIDEIWELFSAVGTVIGVWPSQNSPSSSPDGEVYLVEMKSYDDAARAMDLNDDGINVEILELPLLETAK